MLIDLNKDQIEYMYRIFEDVAAEGKLDDFEADLYQILEMALEDADED